MANMTNESFMAELEKEYPNFDWDSVPDPKDTPDIFVVVGEQYNEQYKRNFPFKVNAEYATHEEAEAKIEQIKQIKEADLDCWVGVVLSSLKVETAKTAAVEDMWFSKYLRDEILAGKKVFPMYLP